MAKKRIVDDPARLQLLLDDPIKLEKYKKAGKMYRDGFSQRQISKELKMSFRDIPDVIQLEGAGLLNNPESLADAAAKGRPRPKSAGEQEVEWFRSLSPEEKEAEATRLLSEGRRPDEVAYMVALPLTEVSQLYQDYLSSRGLYELGSLARTQGDKAIRKLAVVARILERKNLVTTDDAASYVSYAENMFRVGNDLERLKHRVDDLEYQKDSLEAYIREHAPARKQLESAEQELEILRVDKEKILRECPGAPIPQIVRREADKVIKDNWRLLRTTYDAIVAAAMKNELFKYALFPGMIPPDFWRRYIHNSHDITQLNKELGETIIQEADKQIRRVLIQELERSSIQQL